jgi:two-component sensor histidine kinase
VTVSPVTRVTSWRRPDRLLPILGWGAVVISAIAAGIYAEPRPVPFPRAGGRTLPRVPAPPADLPTLLHQLGVGSVTWYLCAVAFPFLLWGARRLDAERHGRGRTAVIAVGTVAMLALASAVLQYLVVYGVTPGRPRLGQYLSSMAGVHVLPWIALAGIVAATEWRRRAIRSAVDRERLRAQVAEQRLITLTAQLQPHFLFNTLQGISTLIHRDARAADEMLAKLGDLLRDLLRHRDRLLVPLRDELRYARTFLEIAKLRFAERLEFEIGASPDALDLAVPLFILQPLVENALAHGIGGRLRGGRIIVGARRHGERLELSVEDDGAGLSSAGASREGMGLGNTRERLRASFGADQRLSIEPRAGGGVIVSIDIPARRSSSADVAPPSEDHDVTVRAAARGE